MSKQNTELLSPHEFGFFILGFAIGPAFLKFSNTLVETAKQDAWISALIGLIYPLYVILISSYIISKHPKENILQINTKYYGTILGNILNIVFVSQFILYTFTITSDSIDLVRTYVNSFLSPFKLVIILISLSTIAAYKGIKTLAKVTELITYGFLLIIFSASALKLGSILNIQPVFGSGLSNILKSTIDTFYTYTSWEVMLLFHPFVENPKELSKYTLGALGIGAAVWVWTVFITIFYLGIDIMPKNYWSFVMVFESVHIPIINNFRYVFMFVWTLMLLRIISNYYFLSAFTLNHFTKIDVKKACIYIYPLMIYVSLKLSNQMLKDKIVSFATPPFVAFNIIFITLTAMIISLKNKQNKSCKQSK